MPALSLHELQRDSTEMNGFSATVGVKATLVSATCAPLLGNVSGGVPVGFDRFKRRSKPKQTET